MIGLGTQDSAADAAAFVSETGTYSFPMYWESNDTGFSSWAPFGVTSQPAAALMSADGEAIELWGGVFPPDVALEAIDSLSS